MQQGIENVVLYINCDINHYIILFCMVVSIIALKLKIILNCRTYASSST